MVPGSYLLIVLLGLLQVHQTQLHDDFILFRHLHESLEGKADLTNTEDTDTDTEDVVRSLNHPIIRHPIIRIHTPFRTSSCMPFFRHSATQELRHTNWKLSKRRLGKASSNCSICFQGPSYDRRQNRISQLLHLSRYTVQYRL